MDSLNVAYTDVHGRPQKVDPSRLVGHGMYEGTGNLWAIFDRVVTDLIRMGIDPGDVDLLVSRPCGITDEGRIARFVAIMRYVK